MLRNNDRLHARFLNPTHRFHSRRLCVGRRKESGISCPRPKRATRQEQRSRCFGNCCLRFNDHFERFGIRCLAKGVIGFQDIAQLEVVRD